jgi:nitroreductase
MKTRLAAAIERRYGSALRLTGELPGLEALAALNERSVCRRYRPGPVPEEVVGLLCATALAAPTKSDLQQATIVRLADRRSAPRCARSSPARPGSRARRSYSSFAPTAGACDGSSRSAARNSPTSTSTPSSMRRSTLRSHSVPSWPPPSSPASAPAPSARCATTSRRSTSSSRSPTGSSRRRPRARLPRGEGAAQRALGALRHRAHRPLRHRCRRARARRLRCAPRPRLERRQSAPVQHRLARRLRRARQAQEIPIGLTGSDPWGQGWNSVCTSSANEFRP